jgi:hypothetical protein
MRIHSAHHRVTNFDHPLNGGLGGYCQGNLPQVPWAAGYDPKLLNAIGSLQRHTTEEPYTSYYEATLPLAG